MEGRTGHAFAQVDEIGQPLHKDMQEQGLGAWERACQLSKTLCCDELLGRSINTLTKRLYQEEVEAVGIRMFKSRSPCFHCSCSCLRIGSMLRSFDQSEVDSILEKRGKMEIDCELCGQHYSFDAADCTQLFAQKTVAQGMQGASGQHH